MFQSGDVVRKQGDKGPSITVRSLPLEVLAQAPAVSASLATKLKVNPELDAARRAVGISDTDWTPTVKAFADAVTKYATKRALERLSDQQRNVWAGYRILAIVDGEAYPDGKGGNAYSTNVKYLENSSGASDREVERNIKQAKSLWSKRFDSGYEYTRRV